MSDHKHLDYLKPALEETLGRPVQSHEWDHLCDMFLVEDVDTGADGRDINWLASEHRKIWPPDKRSRIPSFEAKVPRIVNTGRIRTREEALSVLYASQAAEDWEVKYFREEVLGNALLTWEEVPKWIKKQAANEKKKGLPHVWLTFPLPSQIATRLDKSGNEVFDPPLKIKKLDPQEGGYGTSCRTLAYIDPVNKWPLREIARAGGLLEKLRNLSKKLAKRYYWDEAQTTVFILTDAPPFVDTCEVRASLSPFTKGEDGKWSTPRLQRVILTIDPALSPDHVKRIYKQYRDEHLSPGQGQRASRERRYALVAFIAKHPELKTWEERRKAWNKRFPKWRYDHVSNFQRDNDETLKKLMGG